MIFIFAVLIFISVLLSAITYYNYSRVQYLEKKVVVDEEQQKEWHGQ